MKAKKRSMHKVLTIFFLHTHFAKHITKHTSLWSMFLKEQLVKKMPLIMLSCILYTPIYIVAILHPLVFKTCYVSEET